MNEENFRSRSVKQVAIKLPCGFCRKVQSVFEMVRTEWTDRSETTRIRFAVCYEHLSWLPRIKKWTDEDSAEHRGWLLRAYGSLR